MELPLEEVKAKLQQGEGQKIYDVNHHMVMTINRVLYKTPDYYRLINVDGVYSVTLAKEDK